MLENPRSLFRTSGGSCGANGDEDRGCFRHGKDPTSVGVLLGGKFKSLYQCRSLIWTKIIWLASLSSPSNRSTSGGQVSKPFRWRPTHLPIVARHLLGYTVVPWLHLFCHEQAMSFVLSSTLDLAFTQAFHILSTWEPIENLILVWSAER